MTLFYRVGELMRWDDGTSGDIVNLIDAGGREVTQSRHPVSAVVRLHESTPWGQFAVVDLTDGNQHFEIDVRH